MNWKKILVTIGASALVGGLTPWLQSATSGHPIPFTFGTVGAPILLTLLTGLAALFVKPPTQP